MQCAQWDDRSRHAGLRPNPLTRKPRRGNTTAGLFAHQRAVQPFLDVRTAVLNERLEDAFRYRYPGFRSANDDQARSAAA